VASQLNRIIEQLGKWDPRLSQRRLRSVSFPRGHILGQTGQRIEEVFFPETGMISVVVELDSGDRVEAAVIGHQSAFGVGVAFDSPLHVNTGVVQIPCTVTVMSAEDLRDIADTSDEARQLLFAHQQFLLAQAQQTAACNAKHHIPERLCTWLLRARDATDRTAFDLTQEFVAEMLGVQRPSVSIVASQLQEAGLISYTRGHLSIVNEQGLMDAACECYRTLQDQQRRLFPAPLPRHVTGTAGETISPPATK
jgi:CRP-like cAMP-binding protein